MDKKRIINTGKDLVLAFLISVLFMIASLRLFPILLLLLPVFFIIVGLRNGRFSGVIGIGLFSLLISYYTNINFGLSLFIILGPITFTIQYLITEKERPMKILMIGTLVFVISLVFILTYESKVMGLDFKDEMEKSFKDMLELSMEAVEGENLSKFQLGDLEEGLKSIYKMTLSLVPSILVLISFIFSYLNYKISSFIYNYDEPGKYEVPDFSKFTLPNNFFLGTAVMFIIIKIVERLEFPYYNALQMNVMLLVIFVLLVQGVSVISYFLKTKNIRKFFRVILIIFIGLILPLNTLVLMLGIIDSIFDLRKLRKKTS